MGRGETADILFDFIKFSALVVYSSQAKHGLNENIRRYKSSCITL